MLDTAIRNLAVGAGGAIMARLLNNGLAQDIIQMIANSAWYLGMAAISIGIMLYYVVPFMPFLYFFFAVGTWVKGLFEAMVGVPLWALAHIHIDGDGLPGSFAISGYYMLMEIFLRPILIIFGLLASIVIFSAQVRVMNDIWPLVTSNLTGYNSGTYGAPPAPGSGQVGEIGFFRDSMDQLFFTLIYAVVVYMMCMASFKLIARIPDKVMRWMGANVDAFNDQEDIAKGLMGKMQVGVSSMSGKLTEAYDATLGQSASKGKKG
jgi:conjugal transfer/type IV secretion protein DotA/TraY